MKRALLLLVTLFALATGTRAHPPDTLVVGMELAYPPFEMADEKGQPSGVSVDLARALGEFLKMKIELQNLPFDGLIPSLRTGKIDIILSSMTATPERAQTIDFSEPYLTTGLCILAGKNANISTIADADRRGKTIAVKKGTTGHLYAAHHVHEARVLVLDKESAAVLEVAQGKADAFLYDQMSVFKHWRQNADTTRVVLKPFQEEHWAIGIRKGNDDLRRQVNAFLKDFREKQGFGKLGDKWLKEQKEAFAKMGIPFFF